MVQRSNIKSFVSGSSELNIIVKNRSFNISESQYKTYKIFICHSSKDINEILELKAYLKKKYGWDAYVAEVDDPQMNPQKADKYTAKILKNRMENSLELYYVLSKNSQRSTWMPWELGFFNALKNDDSKIKILPIVDTNDSEVYNFEGHEYLELYEKTSI